MSLSWISPLKIVYKILTSKHRKISLKIHNHNVLPSKIGKINENLNKETDKSLVLKVLKQKECFQNQTELKANARIKIQSITQKDWKS